jgi:hypothetical protein
MSVFGNTLRQVGSDLGVLPERPPEDEDSTTRGPPLPREPLPPEIEEHLPEIWERLEELELPRLEHPDRYRDRYRGAARMRAVMQIVVSLIVLGGGLYVLLEGDKDAGQAAAGIMGIVIGYWLR